jgi:hypothetical protein
LQAPKERGVDGVLAAVLMIVVCVNTVKINQSSVVQEKRNNVVKKGSA